MTTFTMQDLNNLPTTPEEDEAMEALAKLGGGVDLKEMFTQMGSVYAGEGKTANYGTTPLPNPPLNAPTPQPTLCEVTQTPTLTDIVNNICTQLQLLSTVIGEQARNTTPPEETSGSLQETIALTLQQADWFKDLIRHELVALDIEDYAKDAVEAVVESEVESYFDNRFDCTEHFDFNDAVNDAVSDRIDDAVEAHMDDAVENYMSNATITISK